MDRGNRVVTMLLLLSIGTPVAAIVFGAPVMYETFKMPSGSMEPTLYPGDVFFARRAVPNRDYGRVVVFPMPETDQLMVKRVIGKGGDRVVFRDDGSITINDWPIPRCEVGDAVIGESSGKVLVEHLGGSTYLVFEQSEMSSFVGAYDVTANGLFVVGDNRKNSHDSRMYDSGRGAAVPEATVRANPFRVWRSGAPSASGLVWRPTTEPWLPPAMNDLRAGLARCLAKTPPPVATFPPAPAKH